MICQRSSSGFRLLPLRPCVNSPRATLRFPILLKQGASPDAPKGVVAAPATDSPKHKRRSCIRVIDLPPDGVKLLAAGATFIRKVGSLELPSYGVARIQGR
jgi:hypothetical protein